MKRAAAVYGALLRGYPAPFRLEYGAEMRAVFLAQLAQARHRGRAAEARLWMRTLLDLAIVAPSEHRHVLAQDLRYAFRSMAARPVFAAVAILSVALGIAANTAIFSLWHGAVRASLPGVERPEQLVILTSPDSTGVLRGHWTGRPRLWVTYDEYLQLRDRATSFSSLMASQSGLKTWPLRVAGGGPEEARGRLVSSTFFDVLGAAMVMGRPFAASDGRAASPEAVISHAYWQRRFGGRPDVLGQTLAFRDTTITIVGVAARGFVGETSGQLPDIWLPLELQPQVIPGSSWLQDAPPDKVMWLRVFGRLRPGVTLAQAEAQANTIFRGGLESFYAGLSPQRRRELLDQRLLAQPAGRGASATRSQMSSSLAMLFAAVATLLLIGCANLANLLLARGAARRHEMAVRLSLGASRGRLARQLVTESLTLALLGGAAGIGAAYVLHAALVRLLQQSEPEFFVPFTFNLPMLAFAAAATVTAALAFGAFPAWHTTRADPGRDLKADGRNAAGSGTELRAGRWLVGLQLALSLPLLVVAGLLARTVYNLQRSDLGFRTDGLLVARLNLNELAEDVPRRDAALRAIQARIEGVPGVRAATFSQLGLFDGGFSTADIVVEGDASGQQPRESALDRVGRGYFATLGISVRAGRDIGDGDRADTPNVCVVNQAFVRRFFGGRRALGLHVTTIDDGAARVSYEVVGVVDDARTQSVRGEVEPRFFVPAEQRPSRGASRTFVVRAAPGAAVAAAVRAALESVHPAITAERVVPIAEHMSPLGADDRAFARLGLAFGGAALALAAIGLYGVLSYAVVRRSREMAIRMAMGARPADVVGMILRESLGLVLIGLAAGAAAAFAGGHAIASRLYGVAPEDPATLALAAAMLLAVALVAALVPARRAARVDPVAALQQS